MRISDGVKLAESTSVVGGSRPEDSVVAYDGVDEAMIYRINQGEGCGGRVEKVEDVNRAKGWFLGSRCGYGSVNACSERAASSV